MNSDTAASAPTPAFRDLALIAPLLRKLDELGYESPSPIQAATIPLLLAGTRRDRPGPDRHRQDRRVRPAPAQQARPVQDQAAGAGAGADPRTGDPGRRGLPELRRAHARLPRAADLRRPELRPAAAAPCAAACTSSSVRPAASSTTWTRARSTCRSCRCLVLDEADEMLRMGFIDDVEQILKKTPPTRQVALFSATMPAPIRRIAQTYLREPGRDHDRSQDPHRRQHPPALLAGQRPAQARRADPHPRGRTVRRR